MYEEQGVDLQRVLTDRGTEYCGTIENHPYRLYLDLEEIIHTRTKARHPQTNGICERFHRTIQNEFYAIIFRKRIFNTLEELQAELDEWIHWYNHERTHEGKYCFGKTPWQTFMESEHLAFEKQIKNVPWRLGESSSIDNTLLGSQREGLAIGDDSSERQNTLQENGQFSNT